MKSWAKKPFTKAALSVIAVGMSIIVCLSGVMLIYKINDSEGKVVGVGESSYEESGAFEQLEWGTRPGMCWSGSG